MPSVNLAPDTRLANQGRKRLQKLLSIAAGVIVLMFMIWGGMMVYKNQLEKKNEATKEHIRSVEMEIAKLDDDANRVVLFENRLKSLDALLNQHMSWEPVLRSFETLLPPQTVMERVEMDSDEGLIRISGKTPDIDSVAQTLVSLSDSPQSVLKNGTIRSVERQETPQEDGSAAVSYTFSAEIQFEPSVLHSGI